MNKKSRRKFLTDLGIALSAVTIGRKIVRALPEGGNDKGKRVVKNALSKEGIDFRYAPRNWQSTYCFPDDPHKSLVGKHGELLYGHAGIGSEFNLFPHVVSVGLRDFPPGEYVEQRLEAPGIAIITTKLSWPDISAVLTSFATNEPGEGRVDNLLIEFQSNGKEGIECSPEVAITSKSKFTAEKIDASPSGRRGIGAVMIDTGQTPFFVIDSALDVNTGEGITRFRLQSGELNKNQSLKFFARFPQEGQPAANVKDGLSKGERLLTRCREYWQGWKPFEGKIDWKLTAGYQGFLVSSARNILEAREVKNRKKIFQVGPTVYRGLWVVDGNFLLEAARYLGCDKEAQEGLESIWDLQDSNGAFFAGAGEAHWKDTAVAVYALIRQAELSQNWEFFNSTYPDAYKGMMYLKGLRDKAINDGTANGKYGLLPRGFGDSGIGGIRSELTNTLWTLVALKKLIEVADRFSLQKRSDLRDFLRDLMMNFMAAAREEMRRHPAGFSYLPMLMKEDSQWSAADERKQPRPQAAQIYLSHAIYPGLLFPQTSEIVKGHIELMKAVTREDIPIETGWLTNECVWPYNAPIVAQVYLWAGLRDLARKTFIGFLNHASPLYAWREEQSLATSKIEQYIGDMPHNWASAECIRYLRHMVILEDDDKLRLLAGIGEADLAAREPITITSSPTRWGRVTISHEPLPDRRWITRFKREGFDQSTMPKLSQIILPRKLPADVHFGEVTSGNFYKNGPDVFIDPAATSWEATWKDFSK